MGGTASSPEHDSIAVEVEALREAVNKIGSQSATARLLNVTQGAVSKWLSGKKALPAEHVLIVEAKSGVSKHRLRPDLYRPDSHPAGALPPENLELAR